MTRPVVGNAAEDAYASLAPLAYDDANQGYALLLFTAAFMYGLEAPDTLVRETDTLPVWGTLLDVDTCPEEHLGFLGQMVGVTLIPGSTAAQNRAWIRQTDGFNRGRDAAMVAAAQRFLTGTKTVVLRMRYNPLTPTTDARWYMQLLVRSSECADIAALTNAVLRVKLGGLVWDIRAVSTQDWQQVADDYATWTALVAHYPTWADVPLDPIGP